MKELHNNHNVYILGAGFSHDAGLPLVSDFLVRMRDSHEWLAAQGREREAQAVEEVLKFRLAAASAAYWVTMDLENIEELFSLASASHGGMNDHIRLAIAATLDFARATRTVSPHRFRVTGQSQLFTFKGETAKPGHPPWVKFAAQQVREKQSKDELGPFEMGLYGHDAARLFGMYLDGAPKGLNTFITFNYDTLLEEGLRALEIPFCYGFKRGAVNFHSSASQMAKPDESAVNLLKLHGSVNWARPEDSNRKLTIYRDYEQVRTLNMTPELIPPTWKKVFENQLETVWERAVEALNTATRVIIVGFSMPPTDVHFKYLVAAGLQRNVSLRKIHFVNPSADDLKIRAEKLLRPAAIESRLISFEKVHLRTYVDGFVHLQGCNRLPESVGYS